MTVFTSTASRDGSYQGRLHLLLLAALTMVASVALVFPSAASARNDDYVRYTVKSGDTLIGLADRYFVNAQAYRRVQRLNRIANPRRIPVGKVLRIPREVLKWKPAQLSVASFSGPVIIETSAGAKKPVRGSPVPQGAILETGPGGFLALSGAVGSRVTVPSQSRIRVLRARRILLTDTLDVEFGVVRGRGAFSPPKLKRNGRYRVRTPVAVSAVRGTVFRVGFDESGEQSTAEVVEGEVALAAAGAEKSIPEGFGTSASEAGVAELEQLLPTPTFNDPGKIQTGEKLKFSINPVDGAKAYRIQVATGPDFLEMLSETVSEGTEIEFDNMADGSEFPNGNFAVRARAISATGIEGLGDNVATNFRRQRLGVTASAELSPLANGFKFSWVSAGEGNLRYDFQLWKEGETSPPLINEIGLSEQSITMTNLEPATYIWRVAVVKPDNDGLLRVWGEPQKLVVAS